VGKKERGVGGRVTQKHGKRRELSERERRTGKWEGPVSQVPGSGLLNEKQQGGGKGFDLGVILGGKKHALAVENGELGQN